MLDSQVNKKIYYEVQKRYKQYIRLHHTCRYFVLNFTVRQVLPIPLLLRIHLIIMERGCAAAFVCIANNSRALLVTLHLRKLSVQCSVAFEIIKASLKLVFNVLSSARVARLLGSYVYIQKWLSFLIIQVVSTLPTYISSVLYKQSFCLTRLPYLLNWVMTFIC